MTMPMGKAMPASFLSKSSSLLPAQNFGHIQPRRILGGHAASSISVQRAAFQQSQPSLPLARQSHQRICMASRLTVVAFGWRTRQGKGGEPKFGEEEELGSLEIGSTPWRYARYLQPPPEEPPNYIPWAAGSVIILIMRKTIMAELVRWAWGATILGAFLIDAAQFCFKWLLENAQKLVWPARLASWVWFAIGDIYEMIVSMTPVKGVLKAMVFSLLVLSLGEAVQSDAVLRQYDALGVATLLGLGSVSGLLDLVPFSLSLGVLTVFLALFRKAGLLGSVIPATMVLVAVGEPIVQNLAFALFLAISLYANYALHDSKENPSIEKPKLPAIFTVAALAVGIRVGVQWLYARHLLWLVT